MCYSLNSCNNHWGSLVPLLTLCLPCKSDLPGQMPYLAMLKRENYLCIRLLSSPKHNGFFRGPCSSLPPNFMKTGPVVFPLSCWQTNKLNQTHSLFGRGYYSLKYVPKNWMLRSTMIEQRAIPEKETWVELAGHLSRASRVLKGNFTSSFSTFWYSYWDVYWLLETHGTTFFHRQSKLLHKEQADLGVNLILFI